MVITVTVRDDTQDWQALGLLNVAPQVSHNVSHNPHCPSTEFNSTRSIWMTEALSTQGIPREHLYTPKEISLSRRQDSHFVDKAQQEL